MSEAKTKVLINRAVTTQLRSASLFLHRQKEGFLIKSH